MSTGKHNKKDKSMDKGEVKSNPDPRIDQDFPGHPGGSAKENIINPKSKTDKKVADVNNKDGEKRDYNQNGEIDESRSDGSAGAFGATEDV